jgi:hypothetical protein
VKLTLFSVEQANRLAQEMRPALEELVRMRGEMQRFGRRLEVMSLALAGASASNPDAAESRALIARRTELASQIREGLKAIHAKGCLVKDLDRGLVDFYSLAGDRLIFLCWRLGEKEVSHWHSLEGGFDARQPLDTSELE